MFVLFHRSDAEGAVCEFPAEHRALIVALNAVAQASHIVYFVLRGA